jgi:outer membrane protein OmpA-like peptidoglycan-associated protein
MTPYVGIGAGYTWTDFNPLNLATTSGASSSYHFNGTQSSGGFSYDAIVGAAFPVGTVPGLSLTAEYRLLGMPFNRSFTGSAAFGPGAVSARSAAATTSATMEIQNSYDHSFLLGLRYAFNTAPPAPPAPMPVAAPAPAYSRTYLVFFDWDRADLTARARQIIKEAADASTHVQYTRIQANGYTDLSGTAAYNQRLSVRRAEAVATELVHDGVPRAAIAIKGFGESNPLVPTAKGVREPQNRRVEIIIQ